MFSVYRLADESFYQRWKNIVIRYLSSEYPNDISVNEFKKAADDFEKEYHSPKGMKKMIGVLESFEAIPLKIVSPEIVLSKEASIVINNTNNQTQNQVFNVDIVQKAIEDELTISQINELKIIMKEEGNDVAKAKPKLVEKLKSFGNNLASNIVANIITNPSIWSTFFN